MEWRGDSRPFFIHRPTKLELAGRGGAGRGVVEKRRALLRHVLHLGVEKVVTL